jgi:trehalose 6-phosphate phosphatase
LKNDQAEMTNLFSEQGQRRLDAIVQPGLLCAFDFDGTLAPIVMRPERARLPAGIMRRLTVLAQYAPVAIITGRSVDDIRTRLGFEPDFVVGNHGLEGIPGCEPHAVRHRALCDEWRLQLVRALQDDAHDPGIQLEDKRYSLSVHYRLTANPERSAAALRELFARIAPRPRIVSGKYVFNLVPENGAHKGNALEQLMEFCGARSAIYVGDDVTDEDVFRLRRSDLLSVRIERAAHSAAEFYLSQPNDILPLLRELTARLRACDAGNWVKNAIVNTA